VGEDFFWILDFFFLENGSIFLNLGTGMLGHTFFRKWECFLFQKMGMFSFSENGNVFFFRKRECFLFQKTGDVFLFKKQNV
jgi:hypothetical protein